MTDHEIRTLTLSELIYINGRLLNNEKILAGSLQIRDQALLEAAVARPQASAFGADAYPTLTSKVAALLHSVVKNHPFTDGNKRTATVAAIFMLQVNGQRPIWDPAVALDTILATAAGQRDVDALARWFPLELCPQSAEAEAVRDKALIGEILDEHRWLLDQLASR